MPKVTVRNDTPFPLNITWAQVTALNHVHALAPGSEWTTSLGSVWFTLEARIDNKKNRYSTGKSIAIIGGIVAGSVVAATGIGLVAAGAVGVGAAAGAAGAAATGASSGAAVSVGAGSAAAGTAAAGSGTATAASGALQAATAAAYKIYSKHGKFLMEKGVARGRDEWEKRQDEIVPKLKKLVARKPNERPPAVQALPDGSEVLVGVLDKQDTILKVRGIRITSKPPKFSIQINDGVVELHEEEPGVQEHQYLPAQQPQQQPQQYLPAPPQQQQQLQQYMPPQQQQLQQQPPYYYQ